MQVSCRFCLHLIWNIKSKGGNCIWRTPLRHCGSGLHMPGRLVSSIWATRALMNSEIQRPARHVGKPAGEVSGVETELARYLPHLSRMSKQLKQTSQQIETSVVDVCNSFQGIAERARSTVVRASGFLSSEDCGPSNKQSFERLIDNCSGTLVK